MVMRNFGMMFDLAVPVDEITSIRVQEEKEIPAPFGFGWLFGSETVSGKLRVRTKNGPNVYTCDPKEAKNFIRSLGSSTDIQGAYADDLERKIDEHLQE